MFRTDAAAPVDWRGAQSYEDWSKAALALLNDVLWPSWQVAAGATVGGWVGPSAARMDLLTKADLEILKEIRTDGPKRPIDQRLRSPLRRPGGFTHGQFFLAEDDAKLGESYEEYDATGKVPGSAVRAMFTGDPTAHSRKLGNVPLEFKNRLQRPRPYQAALLTGLAGFTWTMAKTSMTPAIPSGHAIQGLMGVSCLAEQLIVDKTTLLADQWRALQQLAVDIGDRRVMGGVHYPSDNIASWLLTLELIDHVFDEAEAVRAFVWSAITERSLVYQRILTAMETSNDALRAYEPSIDAMKARAPKAPGG